VGGSVNPPFDLEKSQSTPTAVTADGTQVYWGAGGTGQVFAALLADPTQITGLGSGTTAPLSFHADSTNLYWAMPGTTGQASGAVMFSSLDGTGGQKVVASGQERPFGLAIDSSHVYWITGDGSVRRASKAAAGATAQTVVSGENSPVSIAIDTTSVYWITGDGQVRGALKGQNSTAFTLASGQTAAVALAVDTTAFYWLISAPGGAVTKLAR
jgi:hypothetical protein